MLELRSPHWLIVNLAMAIAGWSFNKSGVKKREQDGTLSYGIPYSEHSSWEDLRACVRTFRPKRLVRSCPPDSHNFRERYACLLTCSWKCLSLHSDPAVRTQTKAHGSCTRPPGCMQLLWHTTRRCV